MAIILNINRSTALELSVLNYLVVVALTGFIRASLAIIWSAVVHQHKSHSVRVKDFYLINKHIKLRFNTEMKQDEYSTARQILKRRSNRN